MAKNIQSKDSAATARSTKTTATKTSAAKTLSRSRPAEKKRPAEQKKARRAIFKTDHWYANAAMSIGIAARSKSVRPSAAEPARTKNHE